MRTRIQSVHQFIVSAVIFTVAFLCGISAATAATYYVATTGNDANLGTLSQPFRTVGKGVTVLSPGDTLSIRGGTYSEAARVNPPSGTSWSNPVTISRYASETVTFSRNFLNFKDSGAKYVVVKEIIFDCVGCGSGDDGIIISTGSGPFKFVGIEVKNAPGQGVQISGRANPGNQFINCKVHNNGSNQHNHGFYISNSDNIIDGCEVYNNERYGIHVYLDTPTVHRNIIRNNRVHNNGVGMISSAGILLSSGNDNIAYNNIIYNEPVLGIQVGTGTTANNNKVYHNTIYNIQGDNGIYIGGGANGTIVKNNIVYRTTRTPIQNDRPNTTLSNNLTEDPKFVNASGSDFRLTQDSPAINAGATLPEVRFDFDGKDRPQGAAHDIGAYEYGSSGSQDYTLSTVKSSYSPGETLSVSWTVSPGPGNPKDWIGFYRSSDTDNTKYIPTDGAGDQAWTYTNAQKTGTLSIITPSIPGSYEFRYLLNDGFTHVDASPKISITSSSTLSAPANLRIFP